MPTPIGRPPRSWLAQGSLAASVVIVLLVTYRYFARSPIPLTNWIGLVVTMALSQFIIALIPHALWIRRARRLGLCTTCGYNLLGTRQANLHRCPECGTPF